MALAGIMLGLSWPRRPIEGPKPALVPAPVATTILDLPPPVSTNPEAIAAYRGAMQAYRDGNLEAMIAGLKKATQLDPDMVAAHLRLGMFALFNNRATVARQSFAAASGRRELLSDHDRAMLEAIEPIAGDPPDLAEADRRLAALVASHPLDAESTFIFGNVLELRGSIDPAHDRFVRASELDPEWALANVMLGASVAYQGDLDAAEKILRSCSGVSATHVACAAGRARILKMLGRCSELEEEGRRIMAKDPDRTTGYLNVAQALASEHGATESVAEALRQRWARTSSVSRPRIELLDTLHLAILRGDFVAADRFAHDLERLLADEPNVLDHGLPAREIAEIAVETGKAADAARVAMRFLDRQSAWTRDLLHDDDTLFADVTVPMLAIARHGGSLRKAAFEERRDAWLAEWKKQSAPLFVRYAWYQAYAAPATTADEATEALAALPAYEPLPQFLLWSMPIAQTGKVYRLAGRFKEGRAVLEKGARACAALDSPMLYVRAQQELGLAREGTGDAAAACMAYQQVLDRWGAAKPKSVTADAARARMRALACPPK
jgi:serine/threonine-protein kinase